jgi:hypothetical protein
VLDSAKAVANAIVLNFMVVSSWVERRINRGFRFMFRLARDRHPPYVGGLIPTVKRAIASDFKELLAILSTTDCTKSALLSAVF